MFGFPLVQINDTVSVEKNTRVYLFESNVCSIFTEALSANEKVVLPAKGLQKADLMIPC